jgi:Leucine-rich repeat (LRR) protein
MRRLVIGSNDIQDISALSLMKALQFLDISESDVGGINDVPSSLSCKVTNLIRLTACTALEELVMTPVPQCDYSPLAGLSLKALSIKGSYNNDDFDGHVPLMPTLERLKIFSCSSSILPELSSRLTALQELALVGNILTPEYISSLSLLPSLTALYLDCECDHVPDMAALLPTQLRALTVTEGVTRADLTHLTALTNVSF